jgi:hypothetical protein
MHNNDYVHDSSSVAMAKSTVHIFMEESIVISVILCDDERKNVC